MVKLSTLIIIIGLLLMAFMTSCNRYYANGTYRGRGESHNCYQWRMASMRTNGPIQ